MRGANQRKVDTRDLVVGEGDCQFDQCEAARLITFGLSTDIALIASAPAIGLYALLRFSQPVSQADLPPAQANPWCFADTGIALLLARFRDCGADDKQIVLRAVGGSDLDQSGQFCNLGSQNNRSMRRILWQEGLLLKGQDLGENVLRSVWYYPAYDRLLVRASFHPETSQDAHSSRLTTLAS